MFARLRAFLRRHPLVCDALIWALPAIAFGMVLRWMLLSYSPYAYWGSDSRSYFSFAELFLDSGKISLYDKRRYLYPIFLLPVTALPGATLKWVAWIQHLGGLLTLVPLAYCVRKAFAGWKAWVIPVTVLYAGMPILLWYEHELLAETFFFHGFVWLVAGWMAFASPGAGRAGASRPGANFWWFFAGLAVVTLTKPAGRFIWPAILFGLAVVTAWRSLNRKHWIALAALLGLTFTIGQDTQGAWLLYTSAFPLTRLESPLHAEYKAEIADLVRKARSEVDTHSRGPDSKEWVHFLKFPERQQERPLWAKLGEDDALKQKVFKELAMEGLKAHPFLFLRIAIGKIIASANPGEFRAERFLPSYFVDKYEGQYRKDINERSRRIQELFGLSKKEPVPPYDQLKQRIAPDPETKTARWMYDYAEAYHAHSKMVDGDDEDDPTVTLTPLAWWVLLGCALALLPPYFRKVGIPVLLAVSYLFGTFLVGGINPRYFGAVWAVVALGLCVPLDLVVRGVLKLRRS
jgi:hypothetical protein